MACVTARGRRCGRHKRPQNGSPVMSDYKSLRSELTPVAPMPMLEGRSRFMRTAVAHKPPGSALEQAKGHMTTKTSNTGRMAAAGAVLVLVAGGAVLVGLKYPPSANQ